uniref:Receptor ligand binding region domain-containing protein n=1 Tax=viral metagenome TaxID=1070528 RepID=A0A6C0BBJ2_9ZZZZ
MPSVFYGTATSTATASASASSSASATSTISQADANQLALKEAQSMSQETAVTIAVQQLTSQTLYVALLFKQENYIAGLQETLTLVQSEFPGSKVVYEEYIVDGIIKKTDDALTDFIKKYPTGNRVTVSETSSILFECYQFLKKNNENIFSLSVSATSLVFQQLSNVFTYGYYLTNAVMSSFMVIEDYRLKNIIVLKDESSSNTIFFNSYLDTIKKQNSLLQNLAITVYDLSNPRQIIVIPQNSFVYLLADTALIETKYITTINKAFIGNTTSCIYLTDINNYMTDIFGTVPAFVSLIHPIDFTATSNKVFNNLVNKIGYSYKIYPFYDILFTLEFMSQNGILVTNKNYLSVSPFQTISAAYSNALQLNGSINGFLYGVYNLIFTKNSILNTSKLLEVYNQYNSNDGTIFSLPQSQSIFLTAGTVPFYESKILWNPANLIQIFNDKTLTYVKFDANITTDKNDNYIAVSQNELPKFIVNYDSTSGLFNFLQKMYDNPSKINPQVNQRMSKVDNILYL